MTDEQNERATSHTPLGAALIYAQRRIEALEAEVERLRKALEWYADRAGNCRKFTQEGDNARADLDRDGGELARAALAGDSHDQ